MVNVRDVKRFRTVKGQKMYLSAPGEVISVPGKKPLRERLFVELLEAGSAQLLRRSWPRVIEEVNHVDDVGDIDRATHIRVADVHGIGRLAASEYVAG